MTMPLPQRSCFYEGTVLHRRWATARHEFLYRLFFVYVDLAEVDRLFGKSGVWSTHWSAMARFLREDHLGDRETPLDESVRDLVEQTISWRPVGPISLLTHFRYFGFQMNPVSFYYCFDSDGEQVEAVVAEVNNTPWNEQHCYVLDMRGQGDNRWMTATNEKVFHVSPFLKMDMRYEWRLTRPGDRLFLQITNREGDERPFAATLSLKRRPLGRRQKIWFLLRYPLMTLQIFVAIYWQAMILWWKGVPLVPHPASIPETTQRPP